MFEHLHTDSSLTGVHHPLRGDERHDTSVPDRIQTFQEKIVMDGLGGGTAGIIAGSRVFGVKHRHIPERDIGRCHVKVARERFFNPFEPFRPHLVLRIEVREQFAREQVFVKCHNLRFRSVRTESGDKHSLTCRRVEQAVRGNAVVMQGIGKCRHHFGRSIERREYRTFQTVEITFVLPLVFRVITDQPV